MDYEKKYKKALERAKESLKDGTISSNAITYIEEIFPELKESEGERVWLIKFIQAEIDCLRYDIRDYEDSAKLDNLQRALSWLEKQNTPYVETSIKDGVYLVYEGKNGKRWCELFNGHNDRENVIGVAFKFGQVSLRLYNIDIEDCDATTKQGKPCDYITSFDKAACDFEGKRKTEMLFERGLSFRDMIPSGWYIPAIGELYMMYAMKSQINEALEYIGAELIKDAWYWSSTEYSARYAWYLNFGNGNFNYYKHNYSFRVRPVSEFNPLTL